MTGRLIINYRGETARMMNVGVKDQTILQVSALADQVITLNAMTIVEVAFGKHEIAALCLQLADSIGMACELTKLKQPVSRHVEMPVSRDAEYVLKSITPKRTD